MVLENVCCTLLIELSSADAAFVAMFILLVTFGVTMLDPVL